VVVLSLKEIIIITIIIPEIRGCYYSKSGKGYAKETDISKDIRKFNDLKIPDDDLAAIEEKYTFLRGFSTELCSVE